MKSLDLSKLEKTGNVEEFKTLIKTYEELKISDLSKVGAERPSGALNRLTGFGSTTTCTLCVVVKGDCSKCVYGARFLCTNKSYTIIYHSSTYKELLLHLKDRIGWMKKVLSRVEGEGKNPV